MLAMLQEVLLDGDQVAADGDDGSRRRLHLLPDLAACSRSLLAGGQALVSEGGGRRDDGVELRCLRWFCFDANFPIEPPAKVLDLPASVCRPHGNRGRTIFGHQAAFGPPARSAARPSSHASISS
jgi:hypothetical protein